MACSISQSGNVQRDRNGLAAFAPQYFTNRYENEWGESINFDGPDAGPVREFYVTNARYWIEEFHLDGLRLDATQSIHDQSEEHILTALGREARDRDERAVRDRIERNGGMTNAPSSE